MSAAVLQFVRHYEPPHPTIGVEEQQADHEAIVEGYITTLITRGFSDTTIAQERFLITSWFTRQIVLVGPGSQFRPLFVWEAMEPILGRERMVRHVVELTDKGLKRSTITRYIGSLQRLFAYVLIWPYIPNSGGQSIVAKYGPIDQPVLVYDYPKHTLDHEPEGWVLTDHRLRTFYVYIRDIYVPGNQKPVTAWRDYTLIVLAGESGLRADELRNLDTGGPHRDLYYEEGRVQTRFGKGANGSGKRVRQTLFTPFAQATLRTYEAEIRPLFRNAGTEPALFLNERGKRISYTTMWQSLSVIVASAREAGVELPPKLCWHDLRRSFATSYAMRRPQDVGVLMNMMGHQHPSTLYRYVRLPQEYCNQAMDEHLRSLVDESREEKE